jgi:uncharacterized protein (DUF58 family)
VTLGPETTRPTARGATRPTSAAGGARSRSGGVRRSVLGNAALVAARLGTRARRAAGVARARAAASVTPLGWTVLAAVPACIVAGYRFGWIELVAAGFAGLVLLAVAIVYLVGGSSVSIALTLVHSRVVVGQPAGGEVRVRNPTGRRTLGVTVEIPVAAGLAELAVPGLARGASAEQRFVIPTSRRGVVTVGPVRTVRADPIGLVRRELDWTGTAELFVHPRTVGLPSMSSGLVRDLEGTPTRDLSSSDISFHALREYQPGDERRTIHWKSTAKTGTYMVRQFEETRRSHLVIALSLAHADYASDDEFEMAVSVAGSLGSRAIREIRDVSVVVSEKTPEFASQKIVAVRSLATGSRSRLLDELAVIESAGNAIAITDVARIAGTRVAGVSLAFLVCGSATTSAELRAASMKFPLGVEVVAVVCDPDAAPRLRTAPGLTVLTIGYLDDLPKALARAVST